MYTNIGTLCFVRCYRHLQLFDGSSAVEQLAVNSPMEQSIGTSSSGQ